MKRLASKQVPVIKERDGIHIDAGKKFVADSRSAAGDVNFVSHAHFDHLHTGGSEVLCSSTTGRLAEARTGEEVDFKTEIDGVELLPSGHIIGSRAALVDGERKVLYTGDVSTRDRLYLSGFSPVDAEVLVIESTYGVPAYRFPPQEEVESRLKDWVEDSVPKILFGYSLGKAQKIQKIVEGAGKEVLAHEKVLEMNRAVKEAAGIEFQASGFEGELAEGEILVAPSSASRADWVEELVERTGAEKAGFSGWASDDSYRYRGGYDETFVLSDHADFDGLVEIVREVDPEKVYTHHGFDEAFASHLKKELGFNARSLKKNQSSLSDF